ncbi:hypothetical protein B1H18_09805 [Streptomyces tsukubensis]|uniref:Translation initiation factor 2 n=1 Tax=Streptomyces tsukubensis TaxID=83656 RepID=A0A1V4AD30_9ACTN|nr:hypothetical protein B1H18_09805 [Streptomyces tsukubensis]
MTRSADVPFLRVPVGSDAHRWSTFPGERTLVVATRTLTSTIRALEVLPGVLRGDPRVTVVFTHDRTSAFSDGALDLLHGSGCRVMPWSQLAHVSPDLILSASENIDVPEGDCPVLILPHGIGFQKYVPDSRSPGNRLSGVVPDALLEAGRAWMAVSHPEQERQLLAAHPKTAGRTLVIGDPCLDELLVSADRRGDYRRAMGVGDDQRLVLLSSTWGPTSLIGSHPALPARLLSELPWDAYRVALILHPNVWSAHGSWYVRSLLAEPLEAGLLLMPPVHDWRPALVASDAVIGDHGSVTLYGAALGKPLALAAYGSDAVPDTAGAELARLAPRFAAEGAEGGSLRQVRDVLRDQSGGSARYAPVAARAFDEPGTALARLRTALYDLLRLQPPRSSPPSPLVLRAPENPAATVTSWMVDTHLDSTATGRPTVTVRRIPAAVAFAFAVTASPSHGEEEAEEEAEEDGEEGAGRFSHLAVRPDEERDRRLTESASVLLASAPAATAAEARRWVADTLARWPGSLLAVTALPSGACLVALRDGRTTTVRADDEGREESREESSEESSGESSEECPDPGLIASAVYTVLRADHAPADGSVTLRVGDTHDGLPLRVRIPPPTIPTPPGSAS